MRLSAKYRTPSLLFCDFAVVFFAIGIGLFGQLRSTPAVGLFQGDPAEQGKNPSVPQWRPGYRVPTQQPIMVREPKLDSEVLELAKDNDRVRVLITLNKHPQRAISDRVRGIHGLRLELAQGRYRKVAERAALTGESMEEAHKEIGDIERRISADIHDTLEAELRPTFDRFAAKLQGLGAKDVRTYEHFSAISADIPSAAVKVVAADPIVETIRRADKQLSMQIQQSVPAIGTTTFWSNNLRGNGQTVAVLDSGATPTHPAFGGRVIPLDGVGFNTSACTIPGDATTPVDFVGHGTHVAGVIMSQGVAGFFLGMAPGLSALVSIKVGCSGGSPFLTKFDMIAGLNAALGYRLAKVVNVSMGDQVNTDDDHTARQFDDAADQLGGVVVVSAGNYDGPTNPASRYVKTPAIGFNVISVANADARSLVSFVHESSAWGPTVAGRRKPDVAAPGTGIYSTNANYLGSLGPNPNYPAGQLFVP